MSGIRYQVSGIRQSRHFRHFPQCNAVKLKCSEHRHFQTCNKRMYQNEAKLNIRSSTQFAIRTTQFAIFLYLCVVNNGSSHTGAELVLTAGKIGM